MNRVALLIAIGAIPSFGFAGELEDVQACIRAAGEYGSAELKMEQASYEAHIFAADVVRWPNATCEVRSERVVGLRVDGDLVIVEGFAGVESKDLYEELEQRSNLATNSLQGKIEEIRDFLEVSSESLSAPRPDLDVIEAQFNEHLDSILLGNGLEQIFEQEREVRELVEAERAREAELERVRREQAAEAAARAEQRNKLRQEQEEERNARVDRELDLLVWVEQGKRIAKNGIRDPNSAQFRNTFAKLYENQVPVVCGEVNGRNGFGGNSGFQNFIVIVGAEILFLEENTSDFVTQWNSICAGNR